MNPLTVRLAVPNDLPSIEVLQKHSLRTLSRGFYDEAQVESLLRFIPTMETHMVDDERYFVVEREGRIVGCGGWSLREPAYHSLAFEPTPDTQGLPKVRAMYVDPSMARQGIGRTLLERIEQDIRRNGHEEVGLDATLGGVPLYQACGYRPLEAHEVVLPDGVHIPAVTMLKRLT